MFGKLILLILCLREIHSNPKDDDFEIANRIVAGYRCSVVDHPYMVGLMEIENNKFLCGGSLMSPLWVITARHCIVDCSIPKFYMVVAGTEMISKQNWGDDVQTSVVKVCYSHRTDDLALLNLETAIVGSKSVGYVYLATVLNVVDRKLQDICINSTVVGWGVQTPLNGSNFPVGPHVVYDRHLQCLQIPVISKETCKDKIKEIIHDVPDLNFCAFKPGADACVGDSGGPLMCNGIQFGIVSSGIGCAYKNFPGLYVDVNRFDTYIHSVINGAYQNSNHSHNRELECDSKKLSYLVNIVIYKNNTNTLEYICSGSMLTNTWVLTASSCAARCKSLVVVGGIENISKFKAHHDLVSQVKECFQDADKGSGFGIALLKLAKRFEPSKKLSFVKFITSKDELNKKFEEACTAGTIIGSGPQKKVEKDKKVQNKNCAQTVIASTERCKKQWNLTEIGRQQGCIAVDGGDNCYIGLETPVEVEKLYISPSNLVAFEINLVFPKLGFGEVGAPLICDGIQYGVLISIACDGSRIEAPILVAKVSEYSTFLQSHVNISEIDEKSKGSSNIAMNLSIYIFPIIFLFKF